MTSRRLPPQPREWIDRRRPITFRFEGRSYAGYVGDTISSALAANGVRVLGRSFKYHRPRGVYSFANHDSNVMMQDGARTNLRADITPLWDGANLHAVNTHGGVAADAAQVIDKLSPFLPVGFYYKAFHKPSSLFPFYERQMRNMAGLGSIDAHTPRRRTPKAYDFCDVLVIGGGPAGLSAAIAAAEEGLMVVLVDETERLGGSLTYQHSIAHGSVDILGDLLRRAEALPNLSLRSSTQAVGYYADNWIALVDACRMTKIRARSIVMATGCYEQPAVFGNNDLPGVMLASGAQRLMHRYAVKPFERVIVLTANVDGYTAALDYVQHGIDVAAIVDLRRDGEASDVASHVQAANIPIYAECALTQAIPKAASMGLRGAVMQPLDPHGKPRGRERRIDGDGIAMSVGWASDWMVSQAGGKMRYSEALRQFLPESLPEGLFVAGRVNGVYDLDDQLVDGAHAGKSAAISVSGQQSQAPDKVSRSSEARSYAYPVFPDSRAKSFVDLDEDVQYKDIVHSVQEGFEHVELLKRYSTFGMGPSQGKLTNVNVVRILAKLRNQTIAETGTTTARPFVSPVPLSHLAGRGFHPFRQTPLHVWHRKAAAVFMPAGEWERPAYYAVRDLEREAAIVEEVMSVREYAGMIDVGTLGKLEINGPDAATFIERIYTGRFANMKTGTSRYGLMCDESGVIIDDGVVARLSDDRFYVTTTTTASGAVYREMQRWAIIWGMNVTLANSTGAYMAMNLTGPKSRDILSGLTHMDLSPSTFPYQGAREGVVAGAPARVIRVGFVGELGYEIHVPLTYGEHVWKCIMDADGDVRPFGVEAQRVMRMEKAHPIIGQDTDGMTIPHEAHMAWAVKADKPFFVGQRSLAIVSHRPLKRKLIGFYLADQAANATVKECHLIINDGAIIGRVTSVAHSPTIGRIIGLAYLAPSHAVPGMTFSIRADNGDYVTATVVETPFYDPQNARLKC